MASFLDNITVDNMLLNQGRTGPLSARSPRPAGGKGRRGKSSPSSQLSAQDLIQLFQAMPVPNRGYKNPGAGQPAKMGQGMAWFDANNSPEQVAGRQARADASRQSLLNRGDANGASAVDFMKQTKGYTDASGTFVPPTMPTTPSSAYGSGSVTTLPPGQRARGTMTDPLTGKKTFLDEYLPQQSQVQDTKYGTMPGQENGGALARKAPQQKQPPVSQPQGAQDFTSLFPGNFTPKPPVADFSAPDWMQEQSSVSPGAGMTPPEPLPSQTSMIPPPAMPPQNQNPAGIPSWMPNWMNVASALTPEQQATQSRLNDFSNFNARLSDIWPGNDYVHLQNIFPQVDTSKYRTTNSLLDAYRNVKSR